MNDTLETLMKELEKFRPVSLPSVLERCVMVARAKRLYQDAHPETRQGGANKAVSETRNPRFGVYCGQLMGRSERAVEMDVKIGNGLSQATHILLKETPLAHNQSALHDLASLKGAEQLAVAYLLSKADAANVADALDMARKSASEFD